jgi:hypothetical protein
VCQDHCRLEARARPAALGYAVTPEET